VNTRNLLALAALVLACAACAPTQYIMGTKSGHLVQAYGKPDLDEANGIYYYKDAEGRKAAIKKDEVVEIIER
jgi:Bacterial protein of unknown function (DUF903)